MTINLLIRAARFAALVGVITLALAPSAFAGAKDYEFQPVIADVKNGNGSEVAIRLINKLTNKPVEGAVLFRTRLDMSPDSMGEMTAKHVAMPGSEPGIYRFTADFTMAGGWAFKVQAKVPGEAETVEGTVIFTAK